MNGKASPQILCCLVVLTVAAGPAAAWHGPGHHRATMLAAASVKGKMPDFFTGGAATISHCSMDPEIFALRCLPQLRNAERPDNYIDLELLGGAELPQTRYEFIRLCASKGLEPANVGLLPYRIAEQTQVLAAALAEHRKWPDNKHIRGKCLVYAGLLAHYAQDLCQPLHTTIHFDGRARADNTSPRTGIHAKVDALLQKVTADEAAPAAKHEPQSFDELMPAIIAHLRRSHALVERVYQLEHELPSDQDALPARGETADFARERLAAAAQFTAGLYLTAWRISESLQLPHWHARETSVDAPGASASAGEAQEETKAASHRLGVSSQTALPK